MEFEELKGVQTLTTVTFSVDSQHGLLFKPLDKFQLSDLW